MEVQKQRMLEAARALVADTKALSQSICTVAEASVASQNSFEELSGAAKGVYESSADRTYRSAVISTTVSVGECVQHLLKTVSSVVLEPESSSPVWDQLNDAIASVASNVSELVSLQPEKADIGGRDPIFTDLLVSGKEVGRVAAEFVELVDSATREDSKVTEGSLVEASKQLALLVRQLGDLSNSASAVLLVKPEMRSGSACDVLVSSSAAVQGSAGAMISAARERRPGMFKVCKAATEVMSENLQIMSGVVHAALDNQRRREALAQELVALRKFDRALPPEFGGLKALRAVVLNVATTCANAIEAAVVDENTSQAAKEAIGATSELIKEMNRLIQSGGMDESVMEALTTSVKSLKSAVIDVISLIKSCIESDDLENEELFRAPRTITVVVRDLAAAVAMWQKAKKDAEARERGDLVESDDLWTESERDFQTQTVVVNAAERPVVTASLNKLITRLTSAIHHDMKFTKAFITTYRSFTTPQVFLDKLIERYDVPPELEEQFSQKNKIGLRVCNVMRIWMESQFADFTMVMANRLRGWLTEREEDLPTVVIGQLRTLLDSNIRDREQRRKTLMLSPQIERRDRSALSVSYKEFLDNDPEDLVQQLTLEDFAVYKIIRPMELLNQSWNKAHLKHLAPNVLGLIARFNSVSLWAGSVILDAPTVRDRARVLAKMIKVGEICRKVNNFHMLAGLLGGLDSAPVYRLKHTFAELPKTVVQTQKKLQEIVSPDKSYGQFRALIHQVNPPALPYIGVYLKDLVFIEDGNPNNIKGLINFTKRELIYEVILEVQQYQQARYEYSVNPALEQLAKDLPHNDSEQLYKLSVELEPRGAARAQVK